MTNYLSILKQKLEINGRNLPEGQVWLCSVSTATSNYVTTKKIGVSPANLFKSTKVLKATPQGHRLGYHAPEQVSNQEPPDSRPGVLTTTLLGGVHNIKTLTLQCLEAKKMSFL